MHATITVHPSGPLRLTLRGRGRFTLDDLIYRAGLPAGTIDKRLTEALADLLAVAVRRAGVAALQSGVGGER